MSRKSKKAAKKARERAAAEAVEAQSVSAGAPDVSEDDEDAKFRAAAAAEMMSDEPVAVDEPEVVVAASDEPKRAASEEPATKRGKKSKRVADSNAESDAVEVADGDADSTEAEEIAVASDEPATKRGKKSKRADSDVVDEVAAEASTNGKKASKKSKRSKSDADDSIAASEPTDSEPTESHDVLSNAELADALEAAMDASGVGEVVDDGTDELGDGDDAASAIPDDLVASGEGETTADGDDVVGDPITDEAGVEAALLPGTLTPVQLRHLIEALVFAADKPVTIQRLRQLTRVSDVARIEQAIAELHEDYKDRGIALATVSGGYQFRTNTSFSSWVQQLIAGRPVRLSRAQLETLAIVAYRQPITRPEIDEIRGVDSSNTLRLLLDRSLIRVLGKREEVGRPTLYGTTKEFLDFFSLSDLRELPTLREYSELTAESRQVMSDRLGVSLDANGDQIDPETGEPIVLDDIDPSADSEMPQEVSTIDSILAEHAAAEAEAERRNPQVVDAAGALADAALAGGSHLERGLDSDDDAMSMSGEMTSFPNGRLPASEARSFVDAIRQSALSDEVAAEEREARREAGLSIDGDDDELDDVEVVDDSMRASSELVAESDDSVSASSEHAERIA
ncbi:MAG: SMC-Scp complex subunit ScpB [Kofleriaceae bacterium]